MARTSHHVTLRLTAEQWNHLAVQAAREGHGNISRAAREALDRDIDAQPSVPIAGNAPGDQGLSYRSFVASVDVSSLEVDAS